MEKRKQRGKRIGIMLAVTALGALLLALFALRLEKSTSEEQSALLKEAVLHAAVSCYATEGFYPPDLQYIIDHYGLRLNGDFIVSYEAYADNLLPDIRVLERGRTG